MPDSDSKKESFLEGLKTEWSLFWDNIVGDEEIGQKDPFVSGKIEQLSLEKLKEISRALSRDRKLLNQKLESLNKELDLNTAKLESLRLVGGDTSETELRINELSDLGQSLSVKLTKINEQLKVARLHEKNLKDIDN